MWYSYRALALGILLKAWSPATRTSQSLEFKVSTNLGAEVAPAEPMLDNALAAAQPGLRSNEASLGEMPATVRGKVDESSPPFLRACSSAGI
eukprot:Skav211597  [mRNA]  locus=scaffold2962:73213:73488:+ [translate_table: standard]